MSSDASLEASILTDEIISRCEFYVLESIKEKLQNAAFQVQTVKKYDSVSPEGEIELLVKELTISVEITSDSEPLQHTFLFDNTDYNKTVSYYHFMGKERLLKAEGELVLNDCSVLQMSEAIEALTEQVFNLPTQPL